MSSYQQFADALSRIYEQRGQALAQAAQQRGAIWGNAVASLGQIPQQYQQLQDQAQQRQLRNVQLQGAQMELQDRQRQQAAQTALDNAMRISLNPDGSINRDLLQKSVLSGPNPSAWPKLNESFMAMDEKGASLQKLKGEVLSQQRADLASLGTQADSAPDVEHKASILLTGLASRVKQGLYSKDDVLPYLAPLLGPDGQPDPDGVTRVIASLKQISPAKPVTVAAGSSLVNPQTGQPVYRAPERPISVAPGATLVQPETGQPMMTAPESPRQTALDTLEQTKATEQARHNKVMEGIGQYRATHPASAAAATQQTGLSDEALNQAADKFFETGILPSSGMGLAAAADKRAIMNRAAERHPNATLAANSAEYKANSSSLTKIQTQRDAIVSFEKTANQNLDRFLETAKGVVDTGSPLLNAPLRVAAGTVFGSSNKAAFDAARLVAQNEIAKVTSNPNLSGQLSDAARKEVESAMSPNASLSQIYAVARVLRADMGARRSSLDDQIQEIKGRLGQPASAAPTETGRTRVKGPNGETGSVPKGTTLPAGWTVVP